MSCPLPRAERLPGRPRGWRWLPEARPRVEPSFTFVAGLRCPFAIPCPALPHHARSQAIYFCHFSPVLSSTVISEFHGWLHR